MTKKHLKPDAEKALKTYDSFVKAVGDECHVVVGGSIAASLRLPSQSAAYLPKPKDLDLILVGETKSVFNSLVRSGEASISEQPMVDFIHGVYGPGDPKIKEVKFPFNVIAFKLKTGETADVFDCHTGVGAIPVDCGMKSYDVSFKGTKVSVPGVEYLAANFLNPTSCTTPRMYRAMWMLSDDYYKSPGTFKDETLPSLMDHLRKGGARVQEVVDRERAKEDGGRCDERFAHNFVRYAEGINLMGQSFGTTYRYGLQKIETMVGLKEKEAEALSTLLVRAFKDYSQRSSENIAPARCVC